MTRIRHRRYAFLIAAALLAAACRGGGEKDAGVAADVDTTNKDWADGLSAQQIEAQAQGMTPEQAAAAGVAVDTSIHVENLGNSDSTFAPGGDTTQAGAAPVAPLQRDTAANAAQ